MSWSKNVHDEFIEQELKQIARCQKDQGIEPCVTEEDEETEKQTENEPAEDLETADVDAGETCPICYGCRNDFVQFKCTHRVCVVCCRRITDRCPVCRAPISGFYYDGTYFCDGAGDN